MLHIFTDICWKVLPRKDFFSNFCLMQVFFPLNSWCKKKKKSWEKYFNQLVLFLLDIIYRYTGDGGGHRRDWKSLYWFHNAGWQQGCMGGGSTEFVLRPLLWIMQPSVRSAHCPPLDFLVSFVTITHLLLTPGPNPEPPPTQLPLASSTYPPSRPPLKLRKTETVQNL